MRRFYYFEQSIFHCLSKRKTDRGGDISNHNLTGLGLMIVGVENGELLSNLSICFYYSQIYRSHLASHIEPFAYRELFIMIPNKDKTDSKNISTSFAYHNKNVKMKYDAPSGKMFKLLCVDLHCRAACRCSPNSAGPSWPPSDTADIHKNRPK